MSFAVPKGPSYDPSVKRLAIETQDHAMTYADFEARSPDNGVGDVLLWDLGTYETVPPGEQERMRANGHLHIRFSGEKLLGRWHLVKMKWSAGRKQSEDKTRTKAQWLMFKAADETADPSRDIVSERPESVKRGKS